VLVLIVLKNLVIISRKKVLMMMMMMRRKRRKRIITSEVIVFKYHVSIFIHLYLTALLFASNCAFCYSVNSHRSFTYSSCSTINLRTLYVLCTLVIEVTVGNWMVSLRGFDFFHFVVASSVNLLNLDTVQ